MHQINAPRYVLQANEAATAKDIHLSYHGDCHYNSIRSLPEAQKVLEPSSTQRTQSNHKKEKEIHDSVISSVPWLRDPSKSGLSHDEADQVLRVVLEMFPSSPVDAVDFICSNQGQLKAFLSPPQDHKSESLEVPSMTSIALNPGKNNSQASVLATPSNPETPTAAPGNIDMETDEYSQDAKKVRVNSECSRWVEWRKEGRN